MTNTTTAPTLDTTRGSFYLFGYPISHSASPGMHNGIFDDLGLPHRYHLHDTKEVNDPDSRMRELIRERNFGGAAVTMPLKVTAMPLVDVLSPEVHEIGSLNTIVVQSIGDDGRPGVLLGKNTDWEGIHNSLLASVKGKEREEEEEEVTPVFQGRWGFIIGGGGTTRAAVYALSRLGVKRIFLINRDPLETQEIIKQFPQYDLIALDNLDQWTSECEAKVACGVGAIPSFEPTTDAERNVYALARRVFASRNETGETRSFLEMCYKPRKTLMYCIAEEAGWKPIEGVEAMLEQGFAQSKTWLLHSAASPWKGARTELGAEVEASARERVRSSAPK